MPPGAGDVDPVLEVAEGEDEVGPALLHGDGLAHEGGRVAEDARESGGNLGLTRIAQVGGGGERYPENVEDIDPRGGKSDLADVGRSLQPIAARQDVGVVETGLELEKLQPVQPLLRRALLLEVLVLEDERGGAQDRVAILRPLHLEAARCSLGVEERPIAAVGC
eukprot:514187-Hanusia_phi.AAC.2